MLEVNYKHYIQRGAIMFLAFVACLQVAGAQPHWQKDDYLIKSFIEIALKREYQGGKKTRLHRWQQPLKIFIKSELGDPILQQQLFTVQAKHLQSITGHPISFVNAELQANVVIIFTSLNLMKSNAQKYTKTEGLEQILKTAVCMASIESNHHSEIVHGVILIPVDSTMQSGHLVDCVIEELTQVMGLPNDSTAVYPSIFNDRSIDKYLTGLDYLLLKIAYHPLLKPGMNEAEIREKFPAILAQLKANDEIRHAQLNVINNSMKKWLD